MSELPQKQFFKLSEVCHVTDTQPYVLRFWESEFPQLNPERSTGGQPRYRKKDIELVQRIKELLYDEDFTLENAREQLTLETSNGGKRRKSSSAKPATKPAASAVAALQESAIPKQEKPTPSREPENGDSFSASGVISRRRYEDAVDEIDHLRMALKDAEKKLRRAETDLEQAMSVSERDRGKAERALAHLETLRRMLAGPTP